MSSNSDSKPIRYPDTIEQFFSGSKLMRTEWSALDDQAKEFITTLSVKLEPFVQIYPPHPAVHITAGFEILGLGPNLESFAQVVTKCRDDFKIPNAELWPRLSFLILALKASRYLREKWQAQGIKRMDQLIFTTNIDPVLLNAQSYVVEIFERFIQMGIARNAFLLEVSEDIKSSHIGPFNELCEKFKCGYALDDSERMEDAPYCNLASDADFIKISNSRVKLLDGMWTPSKIKTAIRRIAGYHGDRKVIIEGIEKPDSIDRWARYWPDLYPSCPELYVQGYAVECGQPYTSLIAPIRDFTGVARGYFIREDRFDQYPKQGSNGGGELQQRDALHGKDHRSHRKPYTSIARIQDSTGVARGHFIPENRSDQYPRPDSDGRKKSQRRDAPHEKDRRISYVASPTPPKNFREVFGRPVKWIDIRQSSGFELTKFLGAEFPWHFNILKILSHIFSMMRTNHNDCQSLLVEDIGDSNCILLNAENEAMAKRCQSENINTVVHRFSFLNCLPLEKPKEDALIGYAVIKTDSFFMEGMEKRQSYIFEAVLPPPRQPQDNYFIHCGRTYEVHTSVGDFHVQGVLYAQQNKLTTVCAHAAIRMALACVLPDGDIGYDKINNLAGVDHVNTRVGEEGKDRNLERKGLNLEQIEKILGGSGVAFTKILSCPAQYQSHLYGFIESGWPALLGFPIPHREGMFHIITAIGHTFSETAWLPFAEKMYFNPNLKYFPSEQWVSEYIVHDDNTGPYCSLPRNCFRRGERDRRKDDRNITIIGMHPLSLSVKRDAVAVDAEAIGFSYAENLAKLSFDEECYWWKIFSQSSRAQELVLRSMLISRDDYEKYFQRIHLKNGKEVGVGDNALIEKLPDRFWMVEVSNRTLFITRKKFGEILVSPDKDIPDTMNDSLLLGARLPGIVFVPEASPWCRLTPIDDLTPLYER